MRIFWKCFIIFFRQVASVTSHNQKRAEKQVRASIWSYFSHFVFEVEAERSRKREKVKQDRAEKEKKVSQVC